MKKQLNKGVTILLLVLLAVLSFSALMETRTGAQQTITRPVIGDLYLGGGTINVNAKVDGDLVAMGGSISVDDTITGDLLLAGGTLTLNGWIGDDIRAAGGTVRITRDVHGDVVVAGGDITVARGVTVRGNLLVTGGKATVDGNVGGKAEILGGEVRLNGKVAGDLKVRGSECTLNGTVLGKSTLAAEKLHLGEQARFYQNVDYWQKSGEMDFRRAMNGSRAVFQPDLGEDLGQVNWYYLGFGSLLVVLLYLASVTLLLYLLEFLLPGWMVRAGESLAQEGAKSLGYGLLYFIGFPASIVFAFVTLMGIPLGLLGLFAYLCTVALGQVISAVVVANWFNLHYHRNWTKTALVGCSLAVFVTVELFASVPVLDGLLSVLMVGTAFGSLMLGFARKPQQPHLKAA